MLHIHAIVAAHGNFMRPGGLETEDSSKIDLELVMGNWAMTHDCCQGICGLFNKQLLSAYYQQFLL